MRIEIDPELAVALDAIKREQPLIYGRGHVETVRFLVNYYGQHKRLEALFSDFDTRVRLLNDEIQEEDVKCPGIRAAAIMAPAAKRRKTEGLDELSVKAL